MHTSTDSNWPDEDPTWPGMTLGKRVLVAEDDAAMRHLLTLVLRERGCDVDSVSSGSEMLSVLAECGSRGSPAGRFDLIVTGVRMPGASGLDAVDQLRRDGYTTPVIAVTAFPHGATRYQARRLAVRLLAKPFDLDTLRAAIDAALEVTRAEVQEAPSR